MPHIIIEHSNNLNESVDLQKLVVDTQEALASQGVDKARIKSRAIPLERYVVGDKGKEGAMVHITLLLLEGRDDVLKKQYSTAIYDEAQKAVEAFGGYCAVTLEVRDMSAATYIL
jgi:5-carboxymethyl-2-hydroxymuconate isomerase